MGNTKTQPLNTLNEAAQELQTAAIQLRKAFKMMERAGIAKEDCTLVLWHEAKIWNLVGDLVTQEAGQ